MVDSLFDDVKELLDKDFGDDRILKQIYRACENNEVISNYERNYVKKLAEKYLGRKSTVEQVKTSLNEKPASPDVVIPDTQSMTKSQMFNSPPKTLSSSRSKNSKIMLGISGIVLGIIILVAVSITGMPDMSSSQDEISTNPITVTLSVHTDLLSYGKNDIISISGTSDTFGNVTISIENPSNIVIWKEQIPLKNDGVYSTLSIAGGPGWETSGTYTIKVDNEVEIKSNTFSFIP